MSGNFNNVRARCREESPCGGGSHLISRLVPGNIVPWRWGVLILGVWFLAVADFYWVRQTDRVPARGAGYSHQIAGRRAAEDSDFAVLFGGRRVLFNVRHFGSWWTTWPVRVGAGPTAFLSSDGNSVYQNLVGHFGGSIVLTLLALWLVPRPLIIAVLGTLCNVFHEYVAEGWYVDPSFVDLWLDQLGLGLALSLFFGMRKREPRMKHGERLIKDV